MKKYLIKFLIFQFLIITLFSSCREDESGKVEKLYLGAVDEYTKCEFDNAIKYIDMALKHDSGFYQALFLKSKILFMQDNIEESKKIAARLVRKYPEYTEARIWYIRTLIYSDNIDEAEKALDEELSFNFTDWRVFYLYAILEGKKGNLDNQLVLLNKAEMCLEDSAKVYGYLADIWDTLGVEEKVIDYSFKEVAITKSDDIEKKEIGGNYEEN